MGYEYAPGPDVAAAAARVKAPAVTLIVVSVLSVVVQLVWTISGRGGNVQMPMESPDAARMVHLLNGPLGLVGAAFGLAVSLFIIFGAVKMMSLQSHGLALAAAIVASVPCTSPCCCVAMIPGIWAIVVLLAPDVKAAFR